MVRRFLAGAQLLRRAVRGEKGRTEVQQPRGGADRGIVRENNVRPTEL